MIPSVATTRIAPRSTFDGAALSRAPCPGGARAAETHARAGEPRAQSAQARASSAGSARWCRAARRARFGCASDVGRSPTTRRRSSRQEGYRHRGPESRVSVPWGHSRALVGRCLTRGARAPARVPGASGSSCGVLWMFLPRRVDETCARCERDRRRSNPLALALSVRSFAVQLGVAPLRRGCPLRPVSLERLGVTVVSCSASLMHKRLAGTLLGAPQAAPRLLSHSAPLSRRPHRQEPGEGLESSEGETSCPPSV
jgi:hypothetical protein